MYSQFAQFGPHMVFFLSSGMREGPRASVKFFKAQLGPITPQLSPKQNPYSKMAEHPLGIIESKAHFTSKQLTVIIMIWLCATLEILHPLWIPAVFLFSFSIELQPSASLISAPVVTSLHGNVPECAHIVYRLSCN